MLLIIASLNKTVAGKEH